MRDVLIGVTVSVFLLSSWLEAIASPPPDGEIASLVEEVEMSGEALETISLAWRSLNEAFDDVPPLNTMRVRYLKDDGDVLSDGGGATLTFWGSPRRHTEGGQTIIEIGTNYYQVTVRAGVVQIITPRPD